MLVAGVVKTLFRRQVHFYPNHGTFRRNCPGLSKKAKGNARFLELPGM
jgi:hypothetical protein